MLTAQMRSNALGPFSIQNSPTALIQADSARSSHWGLCSQHRPQQTQIFHNMVLRIATKLPRVKSYVIYTRKLM